MKVVFSLIIGLLYVLTPVFSQYESGKTVPQDDKVVRDWRDDSYLFSSTITPREMREHLSIIASDEFAGRETGDPGNDRAAEYIAKQFSKLRLPAVGSKNDYYQPVAFTFSSWKNNDITVGDKEYRQLWDYIGFPQYCVDRQINTDRVAFAGYGISGEMGMDDYKNVPAGTEIAMVYDGTPAMADGKMEVSMSETSAEMSATVEAKAAAAQAHGIKLLLIVSNDLKAVLNANRRLVVNRVTQLGDNQIDNPSEHTNVLIISSTMAQEILGDQRDAAIAYRDAVRDGDYSPADVMVQTSAVSDQMVKRDVLAGQNILGYIEGSDLKDELIVISAHYDHVGYRGDQIYNGADDDGSGTTTVLEVAEAFATAKAMGKGSRRSILCLLVTGEEKGLLGSSYYAENPVFPMDKTVANVNIDMVGRWGEEYSDRSKPYIYLIGSDRISQDLHDINEEMNEKYTDLLLDYKYNDENDPNRFYFRSDHYNFAKNGVPAIFFFNGVHEDYHQFTDTVDKIDFDLMAKRGRLIFHTAWNIANRDERIEITNPVEK